MFSFSVIFAFPLLLEGIVILIIDRKVFAIVVAEAELQILLSLRIHDGLKLSIEFRFYVISQELAQSLYRLFRPRTGRSTMSSIAFCCLARHGTASILYYRTTPPENEIKQVKMGGIFSSPIMF